MKHFSWFIVGISLLAILAILVFDSIPRKIDISFDGILYIDNAEHIEYQKEQEIRFVGKYRNSMFFGKYFKGLIYQNGVAIPNQVKEVYENRDSMTINNESITIVFNKCNKGEVKIRYYHEYDNIPEIHYVGDLYINDDFTSVVFDPKILYTGIGYGWESGVNTIICAPVDSKDEAKQLYNEVISTYDNCIEDNDK
ncbi:MAG: hypothetical protein KAG94_02215 [Clostridiales bacterium]|nr:hypothetical protein [Clostridiales bacterium]